MKVILGAGLAGLSAGYTLNASGEDCVVVEKGSAVGGLARTVSYRGFRFDLGGHRFITKDRKIEAFICKILDNGLLDVPRKSQIYLLNRYFDYPLKPANALFGLGLDNTMNIISDFIRGKIRDTVSSQDIVSLEDWVVKHFGRTMFDLYFKQYSEKVWGIDCSSISQEWVSQRINGLSLWEAVKNAFFRFSGRGIDTLADSFGYPALGIGEIAERMSEHISRRNPVLTESQVLKIEHEDFHISSITVNKGDSIYEIDGDEFVSTIPLTNLLQMLRPAPPTDIIEAVFHLHYRDLVVVTLFLDRERITDLTWLYLPEKRIPIGRIHEPKNWSTRMAPDGKTHVVAEYFCFEGDSIWNASDERLSAVTLENLTGLGFIEKNDFLGSCVVRVPKAYPLLDVDYRRHYEKILQYLANFKNLHIAGRGGTFQYLNMDHAIRSGIDAAEAILLKSMPDRTIESMYA